MENATAPAVKREAEEASRRRVGRLRRPLPYGCAGKPVSSGQEAQSCLEINHKLEFGRCLHRKIGRIGAAENAAQ